MPNLKKLDEYQQAVEHYLRTGAVAPAARVEARPVSDISNEILKKRSPAAVQKLNEYNVYKWMGGKGLSDEAMDQLGSQSFYMPEKPFEGASGIYNPAASLQAFKDRFTMVNNLRADGIWDVEGNNPYLYSDAYLNDQLNMWNQKLTESRAADEADKQKRNANAEVAARLKALSTDYYHGLTFDDLLDVYEGDEEQISAVVSNWMALDQLNNPDSKYPKTWDELRSLESDNEYLAALHDLHAGWANADWNNVGLVDSYESQTEDILRQLKPLQQEQAYRTTMSQFGGLAESAQNVPTLDAYYAGNIEGYDPQWYNPAYATDLVYFLNHAVGGQEMNLMEALNDGLGEKLLRDFTGINADEDARKVQEYYDRGYHMLLPEELAVINRMVNQPEAIQAFLNQLEPALLARRAEYMAAETQMLSQHPLLAAAMSAATVTGQPIAALQSLAGGLTGADPNSALFDTTRDIAVTRQTVGENMGEALPFQVFGEELGTTLYNVGMSVFDMLYANKLGKVAAGGTPDQFARNAMQAVMSSEAAASTIYNDLQAGYTHEQAILHGAANGLIEAIYEKGFMDELFDFGKGFNARMWGATLAEAGEEFGTEITQTIGNEMLAFMTGREGEINQIYQANIDAGMNSTQAAFETLKHYGNQFALAGLSGAAMGAGVAGVTGVAEVAAGNYVGNSLKNQGDVEAMLSIAENMADGSEAKNAAEKIREKQKAGKKVTNRDLGGLVKAVSFDIGAEQSAVVDSVLDEAVENRLVELGEDAANAKALAPVIREVTKGNQIKPKDRQAINWSEKASQVLKELNTVEAEDAPAEWTQKAMQTAAVKTRIIKSKQIQFGEAMTSKSTTTTAVNRAHERARKLSQNKLKLAPEMVAFTDSADGRQKQGKYEKAVRKNGEFYVEVKIDGQKEAVEVPVKDLEGAGDEGLATILEYAAYESRHEMSTEEVNIMAGSYKQQGGDVRGFISQFEENYLSGYSGVKPPPTKMAPELQKVAYEHGKAEAAKDEGARVARATKARSNAAPNVSWLGDVTSDTEVRGSGDENALNEAVKGMTEGQHVVVDFAKTMSRNTGLNIVLFRSKEMDGGSLRTQNGSYDAATNTIYLDVNAGVNTKAELDKQKKEGTLGYAIMRTMGHEVTHAIEATSTEFYGQYKQAVKEELNAAGKDWAQLVRQKLDNAISGGQKLTYAAAEAEVVADASEYMLQDSQFVQNMDAGLKNKVKRIMQDFIGKIRAAFKTLTGGHEESMALRTMRDGVMQYSERLQKLWDAGFMEMSTAKVREDHSAEGGEMVEEGLPVQKQDRNVEYASATEEDFHRDGMIYNYDFLVKQKDASVVVIPSVDTLMKKGTFNRADVVEQGKANIPGLENKSGHKKVENAYTGRTLTITNNSIRHGLNGEKHRLLANAQIGLVIGEVVKNGIPINGLETTDKNALQTYAMVTPCITEDGKSMMAVTHVDIQKNEVNSVTFSDIVHSANGRIYKNSEPVSNTIDVEGEGPDHPSRYTISIADLLRDVNKSFKSLLSKDVLANLGEERPDNGLYTNKVLYSRRDEAPDGVSIREYLGSMKPTDRMTETEKLLLKRYQENLHTLEEKEKLVAEQEEIIRTAPIKSDELTMAKNRYQIYRTQANRAARALMDAERSEGFARLMATSQTIVNEYLIGATGSVADALDEEIAGLTAQLKAVEADVTRTASGQRTAFARGLFDQKQLNDAAQKLKDTYGSRMSVKAIADRLALAYGEIYAENGTEGAKLFMAAARDLAEDMLRGNKFRYKSEILPLLAKQIGTISLTETDVQEIRNRGLTLSEYKRMLSPYIKVVQGGSDLSNYASNAAYYGEGALASVLGEDTEGNLAMRLYDVISREKDQEAEISYEGMSEGQLIAEAMADIAGANLPMSTDSKTVDYLRKELLKYAGESTEAAQKVEQAIMNAQAATRRASGVWRAAVQEVNTAKQAVGYYRKLEEQRRLTELKEQKQEITAQLRSDYAKKLEEKVQKQRTEYREREQKAREYRHSREELDKLRRRIGRNVKRLNTMRMRETDQRHVPQEFQHLANAVMQTFTDSSLAKLAFSPEKTASLERRYRLLQEVESDMTYYWDDEIEGEIENLVALSEAYTAIREREAGVPSYFSVEGVKLETEILTGVDNIVSNVLQMIDSANDAFLLSRNETFEAYATKTGEEIRKKQDYKQFKGWLGKAQKMLDENIRTGNMTPIYFMEHLNSPLLKEVFDEVRMGQSDYAKIVAQGKDFVQDAKEKYHYGAWVADGKLKMKTSQGHQIELTREEAAELYAIAKRESTNKLYQTEHLLGGGFQYKDITKKGEGLYAAKKESHSLDAADIDKISRWLTDEQKAYADTLVGFLSTTMADYGNAASMEMYGYKKFNEAYYIPFHTAAEQLFQRGDEGPQGENAGTGRLKNSGFTKKLQHGANATLVVGGLTDTVSEHIHKMATYAAMVQPIENMKRLLNQKVMENDGTVNTIRALIGQKYGQASQDYMAQLLKDLNGAAMGDERATGLVNSWLNAFKRGAVMASASVVLQQPTAMARAMAYISPRYFAQNPFYRPGKGTWDEMMKYAGTAVIKDMGKFDVGMGLTASQYISDEHLNPMEAYSRLKEDSKWEAGKEAYKRALDWLTAAPGKADQWTWGLIWKAVKAEQAELNPSMDHSSEEFLQLCGDRFDDVIDHTQVYDSVITRSNLMRSKNALHKMATSFMSEPTLSINMLYDAFMGKHDKKQRAAIVGGVITSQVLAGLMAALAQAWNDDEDKRNVLERYADRATSNVLDNLNPFGMLPYVSDLMSLFMGYEVERPDMAAVADIIDYGKTFITKAADPDKDLTWKDYENFVGTLANMAGLPAKNISREIRRTRNLIMNSQWTTPDAFSVGQAVLENVPFYSSKNAVYYERIVAAELNGDTQKAQDYREYMLLSKMVSEEAMQTGLKKALQERFIDGDADEDTAKKYLVKIGAYDDETDAHWELDKWKAMRDEGIAAGDYRKYADFFQAVETGENLRATIQEYLDNGVSKTTLASQITTQYKQQLIDLKASGKGYADLQARLLTAYEALGYDRAQKQKDIQKWFEKK